MARIAKSKHRQLEVRLAENQLEIERALELRYTIFNLELKEGLHASRQTGKDRDAYDYFCDHLIVLDHEQEDAVVGTYRMLRGTVASGNGGFYSQNEFDLSTILPFRDRTAEIGRSCVHAAYRDGSVIGLLWKGIARYLVKFGIKHLMGCGSVHTTDPHRASEIYAYFREKEFLVPPNIRVNPLATHALHGFDPETRLRDVKEVGKGLPTLLKGYIRAGSKIGGHPAIDREFGTTDFFILFDADDIAQRYDQHFLAKAEGLAGNA